MWGLPEVISTKKPVILSLFDGDINSSRSVLELQEIADANCLVVGCWANLADDDQRLSKYDHQQQLQPQCPAYPTHLVQLAVSFSITPAYIGALRLVVHAQWVSQPDWHRVQSPIIAGLPIAYHQAQNRQESKVLVGTATSILDKPHADDEMVPAIQLAEDDVLAVTWAVVVWSHNTFDCAGNFAKVSKASKMCGRA